MNALRRQRFLSLAAGDAVCWLVAAFVFTVARVVLAGGAPGSALAGTGWAEIAVIGTIAAVLHVALGSLAHLHCGRHVVGSPDEFLPLAATAGTVGLLTTLLNVAAGRPVPGTVPLASAFMAAVLMTWYRAAYSSWREQPPRVSSPTFPLHARQPVVVVGAGSAGYQLVRAMLRDPRSRWLPVAFVDDDPHKGHRRFRGVAVHGTCAELATVAAQHEARTVVLAMPGATSGCIRRLSRTALEAGLDVKVLPSTRELLRPGHVAVDDVRDIDVTDLLGRHQIDTDIESVAGYLTGRRVLVTGAGGSIGSELCRQIARFDPAQLIMLDRDESALHAVQLSICGRALLDTEDVVLGDIRDSVFIDALFAARRPEVVFHAAALKHLPMLEQYPGEAIKTNVWGTLSILEAAKAHGVLRFVNISTDKAANPTSVLGFSKRLAEGLTASIAAEADGTYLSVRFGNVLGSRGSVLTAFTAQIARGGPVTVTHPDVTRYFMTVQEAVQLVIQAAAIGRDGEALVLDMGEPVSIDGVARQLIELSGGDVDIVYTGLRAGEKLHEELWGDGESDHRPVHPLVSHTPVPPCPLRTARDLDPWNHRWVTTQALREAAAALVPASAGTTEVQPR